MALNPRFAGHRIGKAGGHTIELYLDFVCPWSRIMVEKLAKVDPFLEPNLTAGHFPWSRGIIPKYQLHFPAPSTTLAPLINNDS